MESITLELQTGSGSKVICMPGAGKVRKAENVIPETSYVGLSAASRRVRGRKGGTEGGSAFSAGKCITQVLPVL